MKIAISTTTIHTPTALGLFASAVRGYDVAYFVAADERTPREAYEFCATISNCEIYSPDRQRDLGYACSSLLGWCNVTRRNIATLEALRWGADVVIFWDDDNLMMDRHYFTDFARLFERPFTGLMAHGYDRWFDVGCLLEPPVSHRGFPQEKKSLWSAKSVVRAEVGIAAGMWMGNPDIGAVERIASHPTVHGMSEVLQAGLLVDNRTWTVVNSQNTAVRRELVPAFLLAPQLKRFDDILAGLVAQRIMRERGWHVHFGRPIVFQERNEHNLLHDLKAEIWGMEHIVEFVEQLDKWQTSPDQSVLNAVRFFYREVIPQIEWMPAGVSELGQAWCADLEKILPASERGAVRVTLAPSPVPKLVIQAVELENRATAELWVKAIRTQIEILWPEKKPQVNK